MITLDEVLTEVAAVEVPVAGVLLVEVVAAAVGVAMLGRTITTSLLMTRAWAAMMDQVTRVAMGPEGSQWTIKVDGLRLHFYVLLVEEYTI